MSEVFKNVHVFQSAQQAGYAAGRAIEEQIVQLQQEKPHIRMIFAAAPSQDYMLEYLTRSEKIQWKNITAFNMDEYVGLAEDAPQLFSQYLERNLFSKVGVRNRHTLSTNGNVADEITLFSEMLESGPVDIVCLGIGENGHLAFNDPPVADFNDPDTVKLVELDVVCRQQQVNDKCFSKLDDVPSTALTLTIPTLLRGNALFCVVIGAHKKEAVRHALLSPVDASWPATILREHPNCQYFFDKEAYSEVETTKV
ncbi:6-phosphogluconolactonase [Sphingobacterium pedocola]|uniref:Glucosamine-6-phosphate deaminase n=1 Tax=Sphingobacterium pedocola TaxID=2082722 RepID=A0ABR9T802_9SPHI|nr:6-phosphogluconolactonase [Sphingobacterium pedocola]MBE8721484.1 glucosamine-6-phosphate deaminase [Sphingobacterium pedocola]